MLIGQNPAASIGLYVNFGSVNETLYSFEATHLLERMAFKSTTNQSCLCVVREVEAIDGNVIALASREPVGYAYDDIKTYVPEMVELLIDCVRNPAFLDRVINDQVRFFILPCILPIISCIMLVLKVIYLQQLLKVKAEIAEPLTIPKAYSWRQFTLLVIPVRW